VLVNLFPEASAGARRQLLFRAVDHHEVLRLVPGLYCLEGRYRHSSLHPFVVAGVLHSPSHVSFESALAFHGLIPEAVPVITGTTLARSRTYATPLGDFSFARVPCMPLRVGVRAHHFEDCGWAFVASPLRAVADVVYVRKEVTWARSGIGFLTDSLRMDDEGFAALRHEPWDEVLDNVRNERVRRYLVGMRREVCSPC